VDRGQAQAGSPSQGARGEEGIEDPLLADPKLVAIRAYGVQQKGRRIATPTVFVIRQGGVVAWRHAGESIFDRPSVDDLIREVKRVRANP